MTPRPSPLDPRGRGRVRGRTPAALASWTLRLRVVRRLPSVRAGTVSHFWMRVHPPVGATARSGPVWGPPRVPSSPGLPAHLRPPRAADPPAAARPQPGAVLPELALSPELRRPSRPAQARSSPGPAASRRSRASSLGSRAPSPTARRSAGPRSVLRRQRACLRSFPRALFTLLRRFPSLVLANRPLEDREPLPRI